MRESCADEVIRILRSSADLGYIGEPVSQLTHALQAAHWAKQHKSQDWELILAALLHDIGHQCAGSSAKTMGDLGIDRHEQLGAAFLAELGFPPRVCELVLGHVQAKRYLVAKNPAYLQKLSEASTQTLLHQGGPMDKAEMASFERDPMFHDKIFVRRCDELAKDPNLEVADVEAYRSMMVSLRAPLNCRNGDTELSH